MIALRAGIPIVFSAALWAACQAPPPATGPEARRGADEKKVRVEAFSFNARLYREGNIFHIEDILLLFEAHPELVEINKGIGRNESYFKIP